MEINAVSRKSFGADSFIVDFVVVALLVAVIIVVVVATVYVDRGS